MGGKETNDVFLTGVTGGLRRYHEHHGATVETLRITLPISLQRQLHRLHFIAIRSQSHRLFQPDDPFHLRSLQLHRFMHMQTS